MPRTNFNSSKLIRFLADLSIMDAAESKQAFAERLGQWLDIADAITLHAAQGMAAPSAVRRAERSLASVCVEEELARIRTALANSIMLSFSPTVGEARIKLPTPESGTAAETAAAYEPYHRFYLAHQGDMESSVRALRGTVRQALANAGPRLKQLAALDAALDKILAVRERQLLSTVPGLLGRRFAQLFKAHQQRQDRRQPDDPLQWMAPGGWLAGFGKELQTVLLAELNLRLQPTVGLIEALSNEAA